MPDLELFSADLGGAIVGDEEEEVSDKDQDAKKSVKSIRYQEYFGSDAISQKKKVTSKKKPVKPESSSSSEGDDSGEEDIEGEGEKDKSDPEEEGSDQELGDLDDGSDESDGSEKAGEKKSNLLADSDSEGDLGEVKSSHEEKMARLQKKIAHMEAEALKEASSDGKAWQMKGEVAAPDRPENSLLQVSIHTYYSTKDPAFRTCGGFSNIRVFSKIPIKIRFWAKIQIWTRIQYVSAKNKL